MYCHSLSVSVAVVLTLPFAITGLAETISTDWIYKLSSISFEKDTLLLFIVTDMVSLYGPRALIL
jgi:hypothetical protein